MKNKKESVPQWFKDENNNFTWEQVLGRAFPKDLCVRDLKSPRPYCSRSCRFPDGVRVGKYEYYRAIVMHDGEEVDIYRLKSIKRK